MGRPRRSDIDARLLAATRRLLATEEYRDVTMEAVAVEAGVGKPALYRRWPNKAALVFAATVDASVPAGVPDTGSFVADVRALLVGLVDSLRDAPREAIADQLGMMITDEEFSAEVQRRSTGPQQQSVDEIWRRAVRRGDVDATVHGEELLADVASVVVMRTLVYHRPIDEHGVDRIVAAIERITAPRPDRR